MKSSHWHISPWADTVAYHASWIFLLVPLALAGGAGTQHGIGFAALLVALTLNFVHRHLSLPYAYLDREVFRAHRARLLLMPVFLVAACAATPWIPMNGWFAAVVFATLLWNFWHVLMQKYGILRLYAVKAEKLGGGPRSATVDKLFIWSWVPLFFFHLLPKHGGVALERGPTIRPVVEPLLGILAKGQWATVPLSAMLAIGVAALFLRREISAQASPARLAFAAGLLGLYASFLFLDPVHVYLAFAFNHALEYMVFVGAHLRGKHAKGALDSALAPAARRPLAWGLGFTAMLGGFFLLFRYGGFRVGGMSGAHWIFFWGVYQSVTHFYLDGFLWKMRKPELRAQLVGEIRGEPATRPGRRQARRQEKTLLPGA